MANSTVTCILITILVTFYTYLILEFVDNILSEPRIKKPYRVIFGGLNAAMLWFAMVVKEMHVPNIFAIIFIVLFIEFTIFYKDSIKKTYFVAAALDLHLMAIHSLLVSVLGFIRGSTCLEIISSPNYISDTLSIIMFTLIVVLLLVIKKMPTDKIRMVSEHKDQLSFLNIWVTVFDFYLIMNARVYTEQSYEQVVLENQIIMPIAIIIGLYVVLYFAFCMSNLLGYKKENSKLIEGFYKEQQYREAFISEAIVSYEINFTKEALVSGFENYKEKFGEKSEDYKFMQNELITRVVHPEDAKSVYEHTDSHKMLKLFANGVVEVKHDYRRLNDDGEYFWVRSITHLYQDRVTGDVMGFTYTKDINEEKQLQRQLLDRAEKDSLTGLYNKGTAELKIESYLNGDIERKNIGALFLVDVDNFKSINDHLGHSKGDEVLCELTSKLRSIFRADDIVGRVGGDEFIVYLKRRSDNKIIEEKAKEICADFIKTYTSTFGVAYTVSASVGISVYPEHGTSFAELYKMADIALYNSKNRGKNTYSIYEGESFVGYQSSRTKIDEENEKSRSHFIDNRKGYVFDTLYRTESIESGINEVLELLTKHYNYSRGYIFETSEDGTTTRNTFERCNNGISPEIDTLKDVPIEAAETSTRAFLSEGRFVMKSLDSLPELDRSVLEPQGIKSMLQFPIFESKKLIGFIGFDDCISERSPAEKEIEELGAVCNIIATFLVKHRIKERLDSLSNSI